MTNLEQTDFDKLRIVHYPESVALDTVGKAYVNGITLERAILGDVRFGFADFKTKNEMDESKFGLGLIVYFGETKQTAKTCKYFFYAGKERMMGLFDHMDVFDMKSLEGREVVALKTVNDCIGFYKRTTETE